MTNGIPAKYQNLPPLIIQLMEAMANPYSSQTHRDNARNTLMTIRDGINWSLDNIDAKPKKK